MSVPSQERYGLYIGGVRRAALEQRYTTIDPGREEPLAEVAQAGRRTSIRAVKAAREAYAERWSAIRRANAQIPVPHRAHPAGALSRSSRGLESMNGGKPIRESRDVDLPLAAAHFFYYDGVGPTSSSTRSQPKPRPLGVAGQIIPWNFPLLMLAWRSRLRSLPATPSC